MSEIKPIGLLREAWGPRFWKVLHVLAEHSGNQINQITSNDEVDAWILLLKTQAFVMPCALCKQHYLEWYGQQKLDGLKEYVGEKRRDWLRKWLWGCHKRVNEMNQNILVLLCAKYTVKCNIIFRIKKFSNSHNNTIVKYFGYLSKVTISCILS
jgi:bisphosphoglycerate-dependent phosphoglycerate mutase